MTKSKFLKNITHNGLYEGGVDVEANMVNVGALIKEYVQGSDIWDRYDKTIKIEKKTDVKQFIHTMIFELVLWTTKDMNKEVDMVWKKVQSATRNVDAVDRSYVSKMIDCISKHYRLEYKANRAMAEIYEKQDRKLKVTTSKKGGSTNYQKLADNGKLTKQARIELLHFQYELKAGTIAELMDLKTTRVNNSLRIARRRLEKETTNKKEQNWI